MQKGTCNGLGDDLHLVFSFPATPDGELSFNKGYTGFRQLCIEWPQRFWPYAIAAERVPSITDTTLSAHDPAHDRSPQYDIRGPEKRSKLSDGDHTEFSISQFSLHAVRAVRNTLDIAERAVCSSDLTCESRLNTGPGLKEKEGGRRINTRHRDHWNVRNPSQRYRKTER